MAPATHNVRHSILITTLADVDQSPVFLATPVSTAARHSTESLRIVIISQAFNPPPGTSGSDAPAPAAGVSRTDAWDDVQRILTFVYVQATKIAQDLGRVLLDIDVLPKGTADPSPLPEDIIAAAERIYTVTPHDVPFPALPEALERRRSEFLALGPDSEHHHPAHAHKPSDLAEALPPTYPVVALGGTFDHLHPGHKILLSMGAWLARDKLIVGITADALLTKKAWKEVLEPLPVRIARTRAFCELFKPGVTYDLVPINDVYGPTGWDPNVQALVVSHETLQGASSIDKRRNELSLPALRTFVIDVISATEASLDAEDAALLKTAKLSSTYIREWIVGNQKPAEASRS